MPKTILSKQYYTILIWTMNNQDSNVYERVASEWHYYIVCRYDENPLDVGSKKETIQYQIIVSVLIFSVTF